MEREAVGADGRSTGGAELRQRDAQAFLRVDTDRFVGAEHRNLFRLSVHELFELLGILQIVDVGRHAT